VALWRRLLAGSDWSQFLDLLSPALFDVVSPLQLSHRAAELARRWFETERASQLAQQLDERAVAIGLDVRVVAETLERSYVPFRARLAGEKLCQPAGDGNRLLQYFFFQIYAGDSGFLDLRASRFCRASEPGKIAFRPLPLYATWQPDFVQGIRQLYDGFYGGDESDYEYAVKALGVAPASDVFRQAFGGPRRRACVYTVAGFRETFHEVFVRCRDAKVAFHPDFITLGIAIATLYDHLESLGGCYDVEAQHSAVKGLLAGSSPGA